MPTASVLSYRVANSGLIGRLIFLAMNTPCTEENNEEMDHALNLIGQHFADGQPADALAFDLHAYGTSLMQRFHSIGDSNGNFELRRSKDNPAALEFVRLTVTGKDHTVYPIPIPKA